MVKYDNTLILEKDYNDSIYGLKNDYDFYSILKKSAFNHISGKSVICVASDLVGIHERKYFFIGYYDNVSDFLDYVQKELTKTHGVFFKYVPYKKEAQLIIDDIKEKHGL